MNRWLMSGAFLVAIGAAPAQAANTAITEWNSIDPAGAETATGIGNASVAVSNLDGITITLSNVNTGVNPDQLTEGNINVDNTTSTTQTLRIIAGGNGYIGPSNPFALTGTIGVTSGVADFAVNYFVDSTDTLNGTNTGPAIGTSINNFDSGSLTGPFSFSKNLTGFDSVNTPYGMAEDITVTLSPGAAIFVQGAAIEAIPGPIVGAGLPGIILGACGALVMLRRRRKSVV